MQRISDMSAHLFNLNTTVKLTPVGKKNMCFKIDGKSAQAAKCVKSRIMTKAIDSVIPVDKF